MASKSPAGNIVELSTFLSWGKSSIIGHKKIINVNGKVMVSFLWCKVYARYENEITHRVKGSAKSAVLAFIKGTNVVTIHQVRFFPKISRSQKRQEALGTRLPFSKVYFWNEIYACISAVNIASTCLKKIVYQRYTGTCKHWKRF